MSEQTTDDLPQARSFIGLVFAALRQAGFQQIQREEDEEGAVCISAESHAYGVIVSILPKKEANHHASP